MRWRSMIYSFCALILAILAINVGGVQAQNDIDSIILVDAVESSMQEGYTLVAPLESYQAYLLDSAGEVVHTWESDYTTGNAAYLMENGLLLRGGLDPNSELIYGGGNGGIIQILDWDSNVVWEYKTSNDVWTAHHDIEMLPNGHVLAMLYVKVTLEDAIEAGRNPELLPADSEYLRPDGIIEIDPETDTVVWEWYVWDHLVQNFDASKANYGEPSEHPELVDLNYINIADRSDWTHMNSVYYNAELDQIMLSVREFSEIWIIDHSTTTEEAASHTGGVSGKGGDLLYRWGNPAAYGAGDESDRTLYFQHDAHWIHDGLPGGGHVIVFSNGDEELRPYSEVIEFIPATNEDGNYIMAASEPTQAEIVWEYRADPPELLFSWMQGGAQRLPNGNTFITDTVGYRLVEVTADGGTVWTWDVADELWVFCARRYALDYPGLVNLTS